MLGKRSRIVVAIVALTGAALGLARLRAPKAPLDPLFVEDATTLARLEGEGLSFENIVGADRFAVIAKAVASDMAERMAGEGPASPRRPFRPAWLTSPRAHFDLVGVVNRLDRRRFAGARDCGEVRLVYRLALENPKRPLTRLPMTVNVRLPWPKQAEDCRDVANAALTSTSIAGLTPAKIEINFQSTHAPGSQKDMDDSAEYVLRAFDVDGRTLRAGTLFNTPRADVDKAVLLRWITANLRAIDDGSAVLPDDLLARRAVSVSPRGFARPENRPYSALITAADLASLPLATLSLAKTPELLLRRLDETTCVGCHQTRSVAGFHLLGDDRRPPGPRVADTFNALAVGHSPHLGADLAWRKTDLAHAVKGELGPARPFAAFPNGAVGSDCGLTPGLAAWSCAPGLTCRDIHHAEVGVCVRGPGEAPGDPCEDVKLAPSDRPEGPLVEAGEPDHSCPAPSGAQATGRFCAPNWLGFTGGVCSERCDHPGERRGDAICVPVPAAGYEASCFLTEEPIESCLQRHLVTVLVASCDATHPCRDDYGCARVPNAPGAGACVPPYFLFQARVDGPKLDR